MKKRKKNWIYIDRYRYNERELSGLIRRKMISRVTRESKKVYKRNRKKDYEIGDE